MVAIACLVIVSALLVSAVKLVALGRKATDVHSWRIQAGWLAESGLERAAARLAADAAYAGETWTLSAEQLGGRSGATVEITLESVADRPDQRLVRVQANYPDHPHHRVQENRQAVVPLLE
ncbi:MAG: hypothetical protein JXB62_14435 [Pirellulales bacterium]|nr:hypothetical protein [Pirellulales bacterium]